MLLNGDQPAVVEIEYCLPEYSESIEVCKKKGKQVENVYFFIVSQNSVCVTTKLAQITVERENGCLGKKLGDDEVKSKFNTLFILIFGSKKA